ncbi:hypothetical protein IV471_16750 [Enterococcus gallinarum]|uniref:hypothetical protein n=1 Tax=Enterococcus gallinarum TaxID=1353 RepID=UPI001E31514B|nr:hypothetical protein [Enterococcus gallinarum]MCD5186876.1 hypothetical protein [Enterococcus gallinarum]
MEWRFPRLKRKDKYYRLLHLTAEAGWVDFPEIVKEVQKIGATIYDGRSSPMNYQDAKGIKVIDQESNVRAYATINECVINENLCRATITRHIKNRSKSKDGRTFTTF